MTAVKERFSDTSDFSNAKSLVEKQSWGRMPQLTKNYLSATEHAKQKEQLTGEIRAWDIKGMEFKRDAAKYNAAAEGFRAAGAKFNAIGAGMQAMTAQQNSIGAHLDWQTARINNETKRVNLASAKLDLKAAIAEYPLRHQALKQRIELTFLSNVEQLQQIQVKREPLTIAGMLKGGDRPIGSFPDKVGKPEDVEEAA